MTNTNQELNQYMKETLERGLCVNPDDAVVEGAATFGIQK